MATSTALIDVDDEVLNQFEDVYQHWRAKSKIPMDKDDEARERFKKGLQFAHALIMYADKKLAYEAVYGSRLNAKGESVSSKYATKLLSTEWMMMVMDRLQDAQYAMFFDKRLEVLNEAYRESVDGEGRTKIDAMKIFLEHTKKPEVQKFEVTHTHEAGDSLADRLDVVLKALSNDSKIINPDGTVMDAVLIEE